LLLPLWVWGRSYTVEFIEGTSSIQPKINVSKETVREKVHGNQGMKELGLEIIREVSRM
jgi:hypothetical protein